jgi:two-component sensor histidine kinase
MEMSLGQQVQAPAEGADETLVDAMRDRSREAWRSADRVRLRARVRAVIVPGLEELVDPDGDPAELRAKADAQGQQLRAELRALGEADDEFDVDPATRDAREWIRGHLHDTALQILEYIAGDGFASGLSASQIAGIAGKAAHDLRRWTDSADEIAAGELLAQLEQVTAEARSLDARVELVPDAVSQPIDASLTSEQVEALVGAVREAVTNARKHAQASHVVVRVERGDDGATAVTVTDDGVGIDPELVENANGLGVRGSIVGRMKRVGGHASLQDAPGGGTLVTLVPSRQGA